MKMLKEILKKVNHSNFYGCMVTVKELEEEICENNVLLKKLGCFPKTVEEAVNAAEFEIPEEFLTSVETILAYECARNLLERQIGACECAEYE